MYIYLDFIMWTYGEKNYTNGYWFHYQIEKIGRWEEWNFVSVKIAGISIVKNQKLWKRKLLIWKTFFSPIISRKTFFLIKQKSFSECVLVEISSLLGGVEEHSLGEYKKHKSH